MPGSSNKIWKAETSVRKKVQIKEIHTENAARFVRSVREGFSRKEQTLAVAVDLEDAYNRLQNSIDYWSPRTKSHLVMESGSTPAKKFSYVTRRMDMHYRVSPVLYNEAAHKQAGCFESCDINIRIYGETNGTQIYRLKKKKTTTKNRRKKERKPTW